MENIQHFSPASSPPQLHSHGAGSSKKPILGGIVIAIIALFVAGWLYFCFTRKLCANFKQKGLSMKLSPSENVSNSNSLLVLQPANISRYSK